MAPWIWLDTLGTQAGMIHLAFHLQTDYVELFLYFDFPAGLCLAQRSTFSTKEWSLEGLVWKGHQETVELCRRKRSDMHYLTIGNAKQLHQPFGKKCFGKMFVISLFCWLCLLTPHGTLYTALCALIGIRCLSCLLQCFMCFLYLSNHDKTNCICCQIILMILIAFTLRPQSVVL